jgi:DNA transformation protein
MSGSRELAEHVVDLLGPSSSVGLGRFFGGWSLRRDGEQVGIVIDTVYVRVPDRSSREAWREAGARVFSYESRGRTVTVETYWSVSAGALDDGAELRRLLRTRRPRPVVDVDVDVAPGGSGAPGARR